MTMPNLISNSKAKRLKSQFMKSYSIVAQSMRHAKYDEVSLNPGTYSDGKAFYHTYIGYFKTAVLCGENTTVKNFDHCHSRTDHAYKTLDGKREPSFNYFDDGQFVLLDGQLVMIENPYSNTNAPLWIHVDINGKTQKPNRLGYDVFTFVVNAEEELVPMGSPGTVCADLDKFCNIESSADLNGCGCAYQVMQQSDYFNKIVRKVK